MPNEPEFQPESWGEYRRLVVAELQRGEAERKSLEEKFIEQARLEAKRIADVERDLLIIKTTATIWGSAGGFIAGIIAALIAGLIIHILVP